MTRPIPLDPAAPVRSLRKLAGLSGVGCAEAAGMSKQALSNVEARGGAIRLATLGEIAASLGYEVEIRVSRIK